MELYKAATRGDKQGKGQHRSGRRASRRVGGKQGRKRYIEKSNTIPKKGKKLRLSNLREA